MSFRRPATRAAFASLLVVASLGVTTVARAADTANAAAEPDCIPLEPSTWTPPPAYAPRREVHTTTVGYVGMAITGVGVGVSVVATGVVLVLSETAPADKDWGSMETAAVVAGGGLLLMAIGMPIWVMGTEEQPTTVTVGAGTVRVAGSF